MAPSPCYGIDLGTTCSAIGLVQGGIPRVIRIEGEELLPSVVLFPREGAPLVGQPALNALPLEPERGVLSSKRLMGTEHRYHLGDQELTPVDVAARVLRALVEAAAAEGPPPERAVITVPAWFTQAQRADTRLAGEQAGLEVVRIINEPTAAALAHAHGKDQKRRVLVYDLGGGTFDVSLVEQDGPVVEVRASHGDSRLGGDDIDLALVDLVLRRLAETDRPLRDAIDASLPARVRLRLAVEQAKVALSQVEETTLRVPFLLELEGKPRHLELELHRDELDAAAAPFLARTLRSVDQVLEDSNIQPGQIDELLLVGGATLQPAVWHMLHERYGLEGSHAISPRRAVVLGAAIQGAIVDGSRTDGILVDVAPYSLSVAAMTHLGIFPQLICRVITPRNTPLPSRHTERFSTSHRTQRAIEIPVYQGGSADPRRNALLGLIRMERLPSAPPEREDRPIRVELRHDLDGLVHIDVTDVLSGRTVSGKIAADGAEQAEISQRLIADWEEAGLVLGDGLEEFEEETAEEAAELTALPEPDAAEAAAFFEVVQGARARLEAEHPTEAPALLALAQRGVEAMEERDTAAAIERYDALSDLLFELGIYL